jgi:hypothetical protein
MAKHLGSFAGGFAKSFTEMMKLYLMQQHYEALNKHYAAQEALWAQRGQGKSAGFPAGTYEAGAAAGREWDKGGGGAGAPRGVRNNNPGNIEDGAFAKSQPGYMGSDGRFAKFDSVANGTNALDGLLTKNYAGLTVSQLINKYAPPGENNSSAYAATVAKRLGIDVNSVPDMSNPEVRSALRQSIVSVEQGIPYEKVADYLAGNTGQNPALVDASGKILATGGADPTQLHPAFVNRVEALSAEAEKATGQKLSFNELHRTTEQQAEIRAKHEAMPGGVEAHPAAKPGTSYHEFGAAGDMDDNKAARWARTPGPDGRTPIQRAGLEQLGGQTGKNDPMHIQLPKSDWNKTAQAGAAPGSYQMAGDTDIALTPAQAAKAKADLEAHRAAPGSDSGAITPQETPRASDQLAVPQEDSTAFGPRVDVEDLKSRLFPAGARPDAPGVGGRGLPIAPTQQGPESPYMPADRSVYSGDTSSPSDLPSSGVGASVHDSRFGPPQRTGAPPNVGITPSAIPNRPVMGPPQRTGAPPNVGITPSSVQGDPNERNMPVPSVGAGGEYRNMPYVGETASGSQRDPKGVYAPKPVPITVDTGARPDLTARSPATSANIPSKDAQPVSSPALPSTPASDPRFTTIDRPNADPTQRNRGSPQGTALDLSHLWGPNPPLPKQAPTPAPAPAPRPQDDGGDWSNVASAPSMDDVSLGMQIGAAKGGPITQRVRRQAIPSRPMMRFANAGAVNPTGYVGGPMMPGSTGAGYTSTYAQLQKDINTNAPGGGGPNNPNWASMTPAQQQWWGNASTALSQMSSMPSSEQQAVYNSLGAYPTTPAPVAPAAAPAAAPAPAPVVAPTSTNIVAPTATSTIIDPTTTTTTGAPSLPNNITAKSYDPNVDQQTGAGFANTSNTGGTDYSVGADDLLKQNSSGQISGSRKGGPIGIPSRPMMRFAAGGGAPASTLLSPNYSGPVAGGGWAGTPYADMAPNQQTWATNQQTLLGQEKANANNPAWSGWSQLSGTPEAIWPAAPAPAAPAPIAEPAPTATTVTSSQAVDPVALQQIDPTTATSTGAVNLPNSITAKSYDPNVDAQTGAGFANTSNTGGTDYSVGTDDLLQQNASGQISGTGQNNTTILSRKGGPITRRVSPATRRSMKYDDGGGVSPSAAGMPPGLGGQQAIPPIYFNPATYAGAGAPVGKGITQNSATTFNAGAIPSLPMARGGVVAFDDGGGVGDLDTSAEDMQVSRDDDQINQSLAQGDTPAAGGGAQPVTYFTPADVMQPDAAPASGAQAGGPPAGVSPASPEISDGQGNPSRGLIAAIGDGLHWLGDHLGLVGGAQAHPAIAGDPQTQGNRASFAQGNNVGEMNHDAHKQIATMIDPNGSLNDAERNIAVMEGSYRFLLTQGDTQNASKMAASILQYSVQVSKQYAEEAAKQLYDGNLQGAVDNINHASDAVPDGRLTHVSLNKDGTAIVTAKGLDGRTLWQQKGSAEAILQYATNRGRTGQMQWDALEDQAAKYDPTFRDMAHNRTLNANAQAKEDAQKASEERVANAAAGSNAPLRPVTRVGNAPPALSGPGANASVNGPETGRGHFEILPDEAHSPHWVPDPTPTPASATAPAMGASPSPDSRGAAAPSAPPPSADSNQPAVIGVGSDQAGLSDRPGPAIPPRAAVDQPITLKDAAAPAPPSSAPGTPTVDPNAPAPDSQDVSLERINDQEVQANQSDAAQIRANYFTPEGNVIVGGQEYARPPEPNLQGLTRQEQAQAIQAYNNSDAVKTYNSYVKMNQDAMNKDIADNKDLRSKQFEAMRQRSGQVFSSSQEDRRETFKQHQEDIRIAAQIKAKQESEQAARDHEDFAPRPSTEVNKTFALEPESLKPDDKGRVTGKQPSDYYKDQAATMPDGTIDPEQRNTRYNQEFNDRNQRTNMDAALVNGFRYTKDGNVVEIADALRGAALGDYDATPAAMKPYGNTERIAVTITRPSDKSTVTVILPRQDWLNLQGIHNAKMTAKAQTQADTAATVNNPYRAPAPSGQSAGTPISQMLGWRRGGPIRGIPSQPTAA